MMISYYRMCLDDPPRIHAYREAIRKVLQSGDLVLDLGCGFGTYSMFAAQAGAKRVYSIDPGDIIGTAKELAKRNGYEKIIHFFQTRSEDFHPPQRVDLLVTEFFGAAALELFLTPTLSRAVRECLKPGGQVIPQAVQIYVAPFENHERYTSDLSNIRRRAYGLDFSLTTSMMANHASPARLANGRRLAKPALLAEAHLPCQPSTALKSHMVFDCHKQGTVHGFAVWFDLDLVDGIRLSTSPDRPSLAWGQYYLPLERPIPVVPGHRLSLDLSVQMGSEAQVWWQWKGHCQKEGNRHPSYAFRQNNFRSQSIPSTRNRVEAA
jgi:SAM-dependent methyltransferase